MPDRCPDSPRRPAAVRVAAIALLAGCAAGVAAAGGDPAEGKKVFAPCASCHEVGPSARAGFGPPLNRLFGRRAGTAEGFKYSDAMKASGIVWSDASLAAFVKDPNRVVPGTKMRFRGLDDDCKIADLLAYLGTVQAP